MEGPIEKFDWWRRGQRPLHCASLSLLLLVLSLIGVQPSRAQQSDGWQATYWNNTELEGSPVLSIFELDVNGNPFLDRRWGNWRPWPAVNTDFFSARWVRTIDAQPGRYVFSVSADDGIRLYVNGVQLVDEWQNQVVNSASGSIDLPGGPAEIVVEYYDSQFDATVQVAWQRVFGSQDSSAGPYEPPISGWRGEYFNNPAVAGQPTYIRDDATIDFDWGLNSPVAEAINANDFSVRWTRTLNLEAGTYRFKTETDDGVRLLINGVLVLNHWQQQTFSPHTADVNHPGGNLNVQMEYYDALGTAAARLTWERIGDATPIQPSAPAVGFRAEYYNNSVLATDPVGVRIEPQIDFDWNRGSYPVPQYMEREGYSARFTGLLDLPAGEYRFRVLTDDGMRLWVNNQIALDKWRKQPETVYTKELTLSSGLTPIKLEYYNIFGDGRIQLTWERLDGELPPGGGLVPLSTTAVASGGGGGGAISVSAVPEGTPLATVELSTVLARSEPSMIADTIGTLVRTQQVAVLGRNEFNTWLQVVLPDQRSAWVSVIDVSENFMVSDLPIVTPPEEIPPPAIDELDGPPVVLITSRLNQVRSAPNVLGEVIATLPLNTALPALGRDPFGVYIQVQLEDGESGWLSILYLDVAFAVESLPIVSGEE